MSLSADADANEGNSGTTDKVFHITSSSTLSQDVTVQLCISGGTATRATPQTGSPNVSAFTFSGAEDYITFGSTGFLFPGCSTQDYDFSTNTRYDGAFIRIRGDTTSEPSETIIATISLVNPPAGVTLGTSTATYTIQNDDDPYVTISGGPAVTEGTAATFTVKSDPEPSANLDVDVNVTQSGSFVAGGNLGSKTVRIPANQSSASYTVATQADTTDEPNGSVTVTLNSGTGYSVGNPSSATVTVEDDDEVALSITAPADADEGDSSTTDKTFTVSLSQSVSSIVSYQICFSGTASRGNGAGDDYRRLVSGAPNTSRCTNTAVSAGKTSETRFGIRVRGDTTVESDETVIATISFFGNPPAGVTLGTATATYTIKNDDTATASISAPVDAAEGDTGTTDKSFTVSLSDAVSSTVQTRVCYSGTATRGASAGDDYQKLLGGSVNNLACSNVAFSAGQTSFTTFGMRINGDTTAESDETIIATLSLVSPPTGVTLGTSTATYTVEDDDSDTTAPRVTSIERQSPSSSPTNSRSLTWRVTFDEAVQNVNAADFAVSLVPNSNVAPGGNITLAVSQVESTNAYDVAASTSLDSSTVYLIFTSAQDIEDEAGNALSDTTPTGDNHNSFKVDRIAPVVSSVERQSPTTSPTDADSLTWQVTFDGVVLNVNAADFEVSGTTATVTGASQVGETNAYDVTVSGGDLDNLKGTVTLSFASAQDIEDEAGNALSNTTPTGTNDNTYVIDNANFFVSAMERREPTAETTNSDVLTWRVTFSKAPLNVDAADFEVSGTTARITGVAKISAEVYHVFVSGGDLYDLNGTVTLGFASDQNIEDSEGNALDTVRRGDTNDNSFTMANTWTVSFSQPEYRVREGGGMQVTVTLSSPRLAATPVRIAMSSPIGGATGHGVDYDSSDIALTIRPLRTSATATISTVADSLKEGEERFDLVIVPGSLPAGVTRGTGVALGIIEPPIGEVPGLVFDRTHLTWNEADGCDGNHGPSYKVKLRTEPPGEVPVVVQDPNDRFGSRTPGAEMNRVFVGNNDGGRNRKGLWLTFTPGNWNEWQTVKARVACADHYLKPVPLLHTVRAMYPVTRDGTVTNDVYPGATGKSWTVSVDVRENDPPIEVLDLPPAGGEIAVEEGRHKEFRIRVSKQLIPDGSRKRIGVYVGTWLKGVASATRRDGQALPAGTYDDNLTFTASKREHVVRLRGHSASYTGGCTTDNGGACPSPDRTELRVTAINLTWGRDGTHSWRLTWPVTVFEPGQAAPQTNSAPAVEIPTAAVSNVNVAAVDDASATVTWDAVEHATSYGVSWKAVGSDPLAPLTGTVPDVTGTSATIRHESSEPMTLTVTVTPQYLDGNSQVQPLDSLARTATLDVAPLGTQQSADTRAACASDELKATAEHYYDMNETHSVRGARWFRVLMAFGERKASDWTADGRTLTPFTAAEAREREKSWHGWEPFLTALECLETAAVQPTQVKQDSVPVVAVVSGTIGGEVTEGVAAGFLLKAVPAPQSDLTVEYTVAQSGAVLAAPGAGSRTVTIPAGQAETPLTVATDDDAVDEASGSVSVTFDTGTGYTVAAGEASASVTVRDNDEAESLSEVSIAAGDAVTEGASATFTITASPAPSAALDVTVTVTETGDFAASGATGSITVSIPVSGSAAFSVATDDDSADEADGSITATLDPGTGYTVAAAPDDAASVKVSDNDVSGTGPVLTIGDESVNEKDKLMWFTVKLSSASEQAVSVYWRTRESTPVSAEEGQDYFAMDQVLQLWAGQTEKRFWVYIYNDSHDEGAETFEVELYSPSGAVIDDGVAVGTIVNSDPMPAAWLSRFGRAAAEQALDGIAGRMAAPRIEGMQSTLAGQALNFGSGSQPAAGGNEMPGRVTRAFASGSVVRGDGGIGAGAHRLGSGRDTGVQSYSMTPREVLLGSSFTLTGKKDGAGGSLAVWGRAAQSEFNGKEGGFSLDGDAANVMLGADYARDDSLVGLILMQTSGKGGYADSATGPEACPGSTVVCNGAVRHGDGDVKAALTSAVPYAALKVSERLNLWGAAGYGSGEMTLKPDSGGSYRSDLAWTMAAAGLRGEVIEPQAHGSGPALAVTSDGLWTRTVSDRTNRLAASDSEVTRLRFGLEGSYRTELEAGSRIETKLEAGVRHDGGDAETGFGIELGGGIAWSDPALGLALEMSGRRLVTHDADGFKERGYSASLAFDPDPVSARGPSLALRQNWGGQAEGGLDALFAPDPVAERSPSSTATRWSMEAAYGFPVFSGRFTGSPNMELGRATGVRDYRLGWKLTPASRAGAVDFSFDIQATRRHSDAADPLDRIGFEFSARW
ncbi:MAG: hypothetical protein OXI60_06220 [Acidiferrobacterales bacterium]|nr:hypothetical protein [Acidiferrobacterales bacterium]